MTTISLDTRTKTGGINQEQLIPPRTRGRSSSTSASASASIRERKATALANKLIPSFAAFNFVFLIFDEVFIFMGMSDRMGTILDGSFFLSYCISWFLFRRGKIKIGKTLFLIFGNVHASMIFLYFGPGSAAQWHFLTFFLLPMILFSAEDKGRIFALMTLTILLTAGAEVYFLNFDPLLSLDYASTRIVYYLNLGLVFLIVGSCVYYFFKATQDAETLLEKEQHRSENLLLNVLPPAIAARLKEDEGIIADHFESVTVLFSDIVGFTKFSRNVSPAELVQYLNELFSRFDDLSVKHNLEKIKTIGDAYMVVSGIPEPQDNHAERMAAMAYDMDQAIREWDAKHKLDLKLRIGMHSGSVVAGVIGKRKFTYDLWGDTVNTASRMESHGEPGKIHLSEATAGLLAGKYVLTPRGEIEVKGKGAMTTYFLGAAE